MEGGGWKRKLLAQSQELTLVSSLLIFFLSSRGFCAYKINFTIRLKLRCVRDSVVYEIWQDDIGFSVDENWLINNIRLPKSNDLLSISWPVKKTFKSFKRVSLPSSSCHVTRYSSNKPFLNASFTATMVGPGLLGSPLAVAFFTLPNAPWPRSLRKNSCSRGNSRGSEVSSILKNKCYVV